MGFAAAMAAVTVLPPAALIAPAAAGVPVPAAADTALAFPGAVGWAARTPGGRGGRILRVTTLAADGPDTSAGLALDRFGGLGDLKLHATDNLAFNRSGQPAQLIYEDKRYGGRLRPSPPPVYLPPGLTSE